MGYESFNGKQIQVLEELNEIYEEQEELKEDDDNVSQNLNADTPFEIEEK